MLLITAMARSSFNSVALVNGRFVFFPKFFEKTRVTM